MLNNVARWMNTDEKIERMGTTQQRSWGWIIPILLLAGWLSARQLSADILFVDEYWSIRNSGGVPFGPLGFVGIWERTATVDPGGMGVLYHWLLAGWGVFIGSSPFAIRVFSLLAGLLTIAGTYRLGARLFSHRIGLYAALVLGTSAFFIDYMHEGRAYTLLTLWAVLAIYAYWGAMQGKRLWQIVLALALAALAYTHYVALAMGAAIGLYHLLVFKPSRHWWLTLGAMTLGGLLFLPWLGVTLQVIQRGTMDTNRQGDSMLALAIVQNVLHTVSNANLALLGLLLLYSLKRFSKQALLIWLWLGVCFGLVLVVNALIPFMVHLRYVLLIWPAVALLIALGIAELRHIGVAATALLLVWGAVGTYQSLNPAFIEMQFGQIYRAPATGFDDARAILDERGKADDLALFHIIPPSFEPFNYFVLGYYMDRTPFQYDQFERMNNSFAGGDNDYLLDVQAVLQNADAVWTMRNPLLDTTQRSGVVDYTLTTAYATCGTLMQRDDMHMHLYVRPPENAPTTRFLHDESTLIGLHDMARTHLTNHSFEVVLGWDLPNTLPPETYSIAAFLLDEGGQIVAQVDVPLPNERPFACTNIAIPINDLATATYTVQIVIYNWQTGERLPVQHVDSDSVVLRQLDIQ